MVVQGVTFVAGAWAAWMFFEADDAVTHCAGGCPSAVLLLMSPMIKMAMWPNDPGESADARAEADRASTGHAPRPGWSRSAAVRCGTGSRVAELRAERHEWAGSWRRPKCNATLSPFDAAAILIVLAAALGYLNHRFLGLPSSVGLTIMGAVASLIVVGIDRLLPGSDLAERVVGFLAGIDFHATLMDGMLSFLLFAGALHVDWTEMRRGRWPILVLSTVGVLLSTLIVGGGFYLLTAALGLGVPLLWCFVFGALISPTDPVAVMGVLKRAAVPPTLQATVAGESLFNDGVGVVVFTIVLAAAVGTEPFSARPRGAGLSDRGGRRRAARPGGRLDRLSRDAQHRRI